MSNLHYLFNTAYYDELSNETLSNPQIPKRDGIMESDTPEPLSEADFIQKNQILFQPLDEQDLGKSKKILSDRNKAIKKSLNSLTHCKEGTPKQQFHTFTLETLYPGLLLGVGYPHDIGGSNNAIQLGFSFDYVTGLPVIPGSSVKGTLRSTFRNYSDFVLECLPEEKRNIDLEKLEYDIFGEWVKGNGKNTPKRGQDIFLDATLFRGTSTTGRILNEEYITAHKSKKKEIPDEMAEPNPIKILKVLPDVQFQFSFILRDSVIDKITISSQEKENLFKELLLLFGIGAKTNVGYGSLKSVERKEQNE